MALRREIEGDGAAVEHAEHDDFAVQAGRGRDAEHDILAAHGDADAAVLRQAPLGDVELGEDLQARDDGRREAGRMRLRLLQIAVIAVADAHPVFERLDMNVGGHALDRLGDDLVDQADDRRFARHVLQPLGIILRRRGLRRFRVARPRGRAGRELLQARWGRRPRCAIQPSGERNGGAGEMVERIGHGDDESVPCRPARSPAARRGPRAGNAGAADPAIPDRQDNVPESQSKRRAGGPAFRQSTLRDEAELDQRLRAADAALTGDGARAFQRERIAKAGSDQQVESRIRGAIGVNCCGRYPHP